MLYSLTLLTSIMVIFSGIYVMARGEWSKLGLKFAGVSLSTIAAMWLLAANFVYPTHLLACPIDLPPTACLTMQMYLILRNVAFILFHLSMGHDAVQWKNRTRRGTECQTNFLKQSPR